MATDRRESTISIGERRIAVTELGSGDPLLLLHGGGPGSDGASTFVRNLDPLAQTYRLIVPDLPGYGRSTKDLDRRDPFGDLAGTVRSVLDGLGVESAHILGHSLGGAAAIRTAIEAPGRLRRMVLVAPGGVGTTRSLPLPGLNRLLGYYSGDGPTREKLARFLRDDLVHDSTAITDDMIDRRFTASLDPEVAAAPPLRRPSGLGALGTLVRMDLTRDRRLRRVEVPTLVVWGANDRVNRPSGADRLARLMPACTSVVLPETGHWANWERHDELHDLITQFIPLGR